MVYGCTFSRAVSYGLDYNAHFIELSQKVNGHTFLLELSHMVYGCTFSIAASYGLWVHILARAVS